MTNKNLARSVYLTAEDDERLSKWMTATGSLTRSSAVRRLLAFADAVLSLCPDASGSLSVPIDAQMLASLTRRLGGKE